MNATHPNRILENMFVLENGNIIVWHLSHWPFLKFSSLSLFTTFSKEWVCDQRLSGLLGNVSRRNVTKLSGIIRPPPPPPLYLQRVIYFACRACAFHWEKILLWCRNRSIFSSGRKGLLNLKGNDLSLCHWENKLLRNPANVKGTDLSSSYFPVGAAYNGGNIEVSTSLYCNIQNRTSIKI